MPWWIFILAGIVGGIGGALFAALVLPFIFAVMNAVVEFAIGAWQGLTEW